jgi:cytochrome c oxidase subunit III
VTAQRALDVSHLPPWEVSSEQPLWWGQLLLAAIEGSLFCTMLAMYYYIRLSVDVWPPPGIAPPGRLLPAICMALLLASCIGSYLASEAAKKNDRGGMIFGLCLNLGLAFAAMTLRGLDWGTWNFKWTSTAYGSIVWGIIFIHTVDVAADLVFTLVLLVLVVRGRCGPRQRLGVHVDSVVWYFLVAIWIPCYITLSWGTFLVGAPR